MVWKNVTLHRHISKASVRTLAVRESFQDLCDFFFFFCMCGPCGTNALLSCGSSHFNRATYRGRHVNGCLILTKALWMIFTLRNRGQRCSKGQKKNLWDGPLTRRRVRSVKSFMEKLQDLPAVWGNVTSFRLPWPVWECWQSRFRSEGFFRGDTVFLKSSWSFPDTLQI